MLLLETIELEKWYGVREVARILGWAHDTIERWIDDGHLQAFVIEMRRGPRKRAYRGKRVQGAEIVRFAKAHLTVLRAEGTPRFRAS